MTFSRQINRWVDGWVGGWTDIALWFYQLYNPAFREPAKVKIIKYLIFSFCTDHMLLMYKITLFILLFASQICSNKRNSSSLQKSPCNPCAPMNISTVVAFTTLITKKKFNSTLRNVMIFKNGCFLWDEIMLHNQDLKFDSHLW